MEKSTFLPHFIEADTKENLLKKMLVNNTAQGKYFRYFDIQKDGKKWVAWFYADIINDKVVKDA